MTDIERIERAKAAIFGQQAENSQVARQNSAIQYERNPAPFQRQTEREGRSEWSGGNMGGGTWGGRSRGEREQP